MSESKEKVPARTLSSTVEFVVRGRVQAVNKNATLYALRSSVTMELTVDGKVVQGGVTFAPNNGLFLKVADPEAWGRLAKYGSLDGPAPAPKKSLW